MYSVYRWPGNAMGPRFLAIHKICISLLLGSSGIRAARSSVVKPTPALVSHWTP
jgi:hypothetical protein